MEFKVGRASESGVALAILLWFIAALALLVGALAITARVDIQSARLQTAQAVAEATGDGAVLMVLAQMRVVDSELTEGQQRSLTLGDKQVNLRIIPTSGLIDFLQADEQLLLSLFTVGAGLDAADAALLAQSVIEWRSLIPEQRQGQRYQLSRIQVLEDLMAVPGMTREIFERIRLLITASGGSTTINMGVAPEEVLRVLADGNEAEVDRWLSEREATAAVTGSTMRIDARVDTGAAGIFQRSVWVAPGGETLLGWQIIRKFPAVGVSSAAYNEY